MNNISLPIWSRVQRWPLHGFALLAGILIHCEAQAFTLQVKDKDGTPVSGFRWLVEEDTTHHTIPGAVVTDSIGLSIHRSYAPVVATGTNASGSVAINVPGDKRYYVSVLPLAEYSMSGAPVDTNQTEVTVIVHRHPLLTAQISVLVFNDNNPLNNNPDVIFAPNEKGIPGFRVIVTEAAGQVSQDAFGNPLGTTYQRNALGFILDVDGNPIVEELGTGTLRTDENGELEIKNLFPGKYGLQAIPPPGSRWIQTTTLEGSPTIDVWVKHNEPEVFIEGFGVSFKHVWFGFVDPATLPWAVSSPGGTNTITGKLRNIHFSPPPGVQGFFPGRPVPEGMIGLNALGLTGAQQALYAAPTAPDGSFTINNVPPGLYQLVNWDKHLNVIIGFNVVTVYDPTTLTPGGDDAPPGPGDPKPKIPKDGIYKLNDVLCFPWYGQYEGSIFYDFDQDGFRDPGEPGIPNDELILRFRDGSIYDATVTDNDGVFSFLEVFPFFKWLVAEVSFGRWKPTGATSVIDAGGAIPPHNGWTMPSFNKLRPQPQFEIDINPLSPTFGFPLTNQPAINPNTGNNLSKTENDPFPFLLQGLFLFAGQTVLIDWGKAIWGPGENGGISGTINYATTRAEEEPRFAAIEEWEPGIPRVQVNLYQDVNADKVIDDLDGDSQVTLADVDNHPFGWQDGSGAKGPEDIDRNNNGVFDAGDTINIVHTDSWDDNLPIGSHGAPLIVHGQPVPRGYDSFSTWNQVRVAVFDGGYAFTSYFPGGLANNTTNEVDYLPLGMYIVEAVPPPGYEIVKEEDKNVDFGDVVTPSALLLPPEVVGDPHLVPNELTLFPGVESAFAGQLRPLADRKWVRVAQDINAVVEFSMFTLVPKAARAVGFVNNDVAAEFDPLNPIFGEKATPSWIPISFQDFNGNEVARVYCDEFGGYNALVPSTYTINPPFPSGVSPNLLRVYCNHPTKPDPNNPGQRIMDPFFDPNYTQTPLVGDFWPGKITYLDTPVGPVGAFIGGFGPGRFVDTEPASGTPIVNCVIGPQGVPLICTDTEVLTIKSAGPTEVPNPDYHPTNGQPLLVTRDFGFGTVGGMVTVAGQALNIIEWNDDAIKATVPAGTPSGQLTVTRGDNDQVSKAGITLTVGGCGGGNIHIVLPAPFPAKPIQDAIDAAAPGDLILIAPGVYPENVILHKPVRLQGSGHECTIIDAGPNPSERVPAWHAKIQEILGNDPFTANEAPGIIVLGNAGFTFTQGHGPRIDGLGITASIIGGGIAVISRAHHLTISNCKIQGNVATFAGGITIGLPRTPLTEGADPNPDNNNITIRNNFIVKNTGRFHGGIGIYSGTTAYAISNNCILGNFGRGNGGGISHVGLSDGGVIAGNVIKFNEVFNDRGPVLGGQGGGIYIQGEPLAGTITPGAGSVSIVRNLIQGNLAGASDGGALRVTAFNGQDVVGSPEVPSAWFALNILNNMIVNNVAAVAGGAMSLQDAARVSIINNTIANNDSTATGQEAFFPGETNSTPQPAGIVSYEHSEQLARLTGQEFTKPILEDNIIWHNRSYFNDASLNNNRGGLLPNPELFFWDLQVLAPFGQLCPTNCILTDTTDYDASNLAADPLFVDDYTNTLFMAVTSDEGGTFINVRYEPLGPVSDYHIQSGSPAIGLGAGRYLATFPALNIDFDRQPRPDGTVDSGADESSTAAPVADPGGLPVPMGDIQGPALFIASHTNNQEVGSSVIVLSGTTSDGGRGNNGIASVTVQGQPAIPFPVGGGAIVNWSRSVTLQTGNNTITVVSRDGSANQNTTVQFITVRFTPGGPVLTPIVNLRFNENIGASTTNMGTAGGLFTLTSPVPLWRNNIPPVVGGLSSLDFGTVPGNFAVDSPAILPALGGLTRFTLCGWVNMRSAIEGPGGNRIVSWIKHGGHGVDLVQKADGSLQLGINQWPDTSPARSSAGRLPVDANAGVGNWRFFAVSYDSTRTVEHVRFYFGSSGLDASFDVSRTYGRGAVGTTIHNLAVGHFNTATRAGALNRMFRGLIDEVQIFGTALTLDQIIAVQRGGTLGTPGLPPLPVPAAVGFTEADTQYLDTDGIDTDGDGNATNDVLVMHLAASDGFVKMADGMDLYTFGFTDVTGLGPDEVLGAGLLGAELSAPTIRLKEGQRFYLKLSNVGLMMRPDLEDPHSVHFHGFPQAAPVFDGVPEASPVIRMGHTFTYFYELVHPGTFIWHCHVEATEHIQMGMTGNLWVSPKQNNLPNGTDLKGFTHQTGKKYVYNDGDGSTYYDVEFPVQIFGFDREFHELHLGVQPLPFALMKEDYPLLNGRGYPDTINPGSITNMFGNPSQKVSALIRATRGQKILLRISSLSVTEFHTLTAQGLRMKVVGKGGHILRGPDPDGTGPLMGKDLYYETSSVTLGGGEAYDVIVDTAQVPAGTYFLYTTRLHHLSNDDEDFGGMMTEIVISP